MAKKFGFALLIAFFAGFGSAAERPPNSRC